MHKKCPCQRFDLSPRIVKSELPRSNLKILAASDLSADWLSCKVQIMIGGMNLHSSAKLIHSCKPLLDEATRVLKFRTIGSTFSCTWTTKSCLYQAWAQEYTKSLCSRHFAQLAREKSFVSKSRKATCIHSCREN